MIDLSSRTDTVVWLGDRDAALQPIGGKAAQLSRLAGLHRVPPGFAIGAHAFGIGRNPRLSPELREQIAASYRLLAEQTGIDEPRVAVRSSAIDEDGPLASFAGQHDTFLNVTGIDAVIDAVERCLASATTDQTLAYRNLHGLATEGIGIAVLVQQLVLADVSAVLFSANPISGKRDEMILTASWGLGESIVGGTVSPDTWIIDAASQDIVVTRIGSKQRMTIAIPGGTREVEVPRMLREQPSLSEAQIREVALLGARLEAALGWPVDIEVAFAGGELFLLQCRPITTLGHVADTGIGGQLEPAA
jgi:phosphoenolpyruvate synthase/pyruvate phosphate dikinase